MPSKKHHLHLYQNTTRTASYDCVMPLPRSTPHWFLYDTKKIQVSLCRVLVSGPQRFACAVGLPV